MYAIVLFELNVNVEVTGDDFKVPLVKKIYIPTDFFVDSCEKEINFFIETEKSKLIGVDYEFRQRCLKLKGGITEVRVASLQIIV